MLRTCRPVRPGTAGAPRTRIPYHRSGPRAWRPHRRCCAASTRDDSVRTADVRRRPGPLHRRHRQKHRPERLHPQVVAYDLSGEEPSLLWDTVGPTENSAIVAYEPAFLSNETQLFFHDVVIDKATGEHSQAPWDIEIPLAQADGIVVTCTPPSTCNGWTRASGEWTNLWTTTTIAQASYGLRDHGLDYVPSGSSLSGSGELTSALVPSRRQVPQIIHIHTGEPPTRPITISKAPRHVEVASDGYVVVERQSAKWAPFRQLGYLAVHVHRAG